MRSEGVTKYITEYFRCNTLSVCVNGQTFSPDAMSQDKVRQAMTCTLHTNKVVFKTCYYKLRRSVKMATNLLEYFGISRGDYVIPVVCLAQ